MRFATLPTMVSIWSPHFGLLGYFGNSSGDLRLTRVPFDSNRPLVTPRTNRRFSIVYCCTLFKKRRYKKYGSNRNYRYDIWFGCISSGP